MQNVRSIGIVLGPIVMLSLVVVAQSPKTPAPVTYLDAEKVTATFAKGGTLFDGGNFDIRAGRRNDASGAAEVHATDTDIFYVLEGTGTFITGGTLDEPRNTGPNEIRGKSINGGDARQLKKGDVIVIPKGVPHWFKEVNPPFLYFVVKVK